MDAPISQPSETAGQPGPPELRQVPDFSRWIVYGLLSIVLLPFAILILDWPYRALFYHYPPGEGRGALFNDLIGDTAWAPGYDERAFSELPIGATADEVRAALGEPLYITAWPRENLGRSFSSINFNQTGFADSTEPPQRYIPERDELWHFADFGPSRSLDHQVRYLYIKDGKVESKVMTLSWD